MSDYTKIIHGQQNTTGEVTVNISAYEILLELANPKRELFSEYCSNKRRTRTADAIRTYLEDKGASPVAIRMGDQVKTVLLKDTHHNFHKSAMLSAVGQAYLDLCLAVSMADYCSSESQVDLSYGEYVSYIGNTLKELTKGLPSIVAAMKVLPIGVQEQDKYPLISRFVSGTINTEIAKTRIDNAINILLLFESNKIGYKEQYESVVEQLKEYKKNSEDEVFFSHVVTVLRNKSDFTQEQMSFVNEAYENRFTADQQKALLSNVPKATPSVEETKAYFFKSTDSQTTSVFDVDLEAVAE